MPAADRSDYAARQAALLAALLRGDEPAEGFVAAQAAAAGRSLRRKRARAAARAWPALALELGDAFDARFDAFARAAGAPPSGDPLADGLAFARSLGRDARLGDAARVELLLARAALRRRRPFVRVAWLRRPHARLLVVARLPGSRPRHGSVRLSRCPPCAGARAEPSARPMSCASRCTRCTRSSSWPARCASGRCGAGGRRRGRAFVRVP